MMIITYSIKIFETFQNLVTNTLLKTEKKGEYSKAAHN